MQLYPSRQRTSVDMAPPATADAFPGPRRMQTARAGSSRFPSFGRSTSLRTRLQRSPPVRCPCLCLLYGVHFRLRAPAVPARRHNKPWRKFHPLFTASSPLARGERSPLSARTGVHRRFNALYQTGEGVRSRITIQVPPGHLSLCRGLVIDAFIEEQATKPLSRQVAVMDCTPQKI